MPSGGKNAVTSIPNNMPLRNKEIKVVSTPIARSKDVMDSTDGVNEFLVCLLIEHMICM